MSYSWKKACLWATKYIEQDFLIWKFQVNEGVEAGVMNIEINILMFDPGLE